MDIGVLLEASLYAYLALLGFGIYLVVKLLYWLADIANPYAKMPQYAEIEENALNFMNKLQLRLSEYLTRAPSNERAKLRHDYQRIKKIKEAVSVKSSALSREIKTLYRQRHMICQKITEVFEKMKLYEKILWAKENENFLQQYERFLQNKKEIKEEVANFNHKDQKLLKLLKSKTVVKKYEPLLYGQNPIENQ